MPELGSLWYSVGLKDLTDADIKKINEKLKNLGSDLLINPKLAKSVTEILPKGIKLELEPQLKAVSNEALAKAVEGKVMKVEIAPLLTNLRKALKDATKDNPPEVEVGVQSAKLRTIIQNVLNKQGFMLNISTVNDNYSKVVQQKLNGTRYTVRIHADAKEITRSVQASLMQVQSRAFGLQISRDILYRSIDDALGHKRFIINVAVQHDQARKAVQDALLRAQVIGKDQALAYQRLQTGELKAAQAELARLKAAHMGAADAAKAHASASINLGGALGSNIKIAGELSSAMASLYSVHAAKEFLSQVIEIGGELEHQKIAMDTIFGDKGKTSELFGQIKGLARQSPFGVMELTKSVKALSAYGVQYNEIYDTAKRLADISAATSVDINRLILAFGKTKSRGFLDGLEAKQFAYANIPIYEMVRRKLEELEGQAVTTAQVMKRMKKREIGFDIVKDVLWDMTDEGGKFYNMQEALAGSVKTSWKLVRDNIELMFGEIAEGAVGSSLKSLAEILQGLTREWRTVGTVVGTAAAGLGIYKVATLGVNSAVQKSTLTTYKNIIAQKQKSAEELKAWGRITQLDRAEKMRIATANKLTNADLRQAMADGALTDKHIAQLFWQKKVTAEQIKHLVAIGQLNPAMAKAILSNNRFTLSLQMMKQGLVSAGAAMRAFLLNPWTIGIAAITALMGLWQRHNEKVEATKENIKQLGEVAREGAKNLSAEVDKLNAQNPQNMVSSEFINSIEEMKNILKDYDPTWMDAFKEAFSRDEAGNVKSLAEQYRILKQAVIDTAEAYKYLNQIKDSAYDAQDETDGWFDDSMLENIKDFSDASREYEKIVGKLVARSDMAERAVSLGMSASPAYALAAANKPLEEQIKLLTEYQDAWSGVFQGFNVRYSLLESWGIGRSEEQKFIADLMDLPSKIQDVNIALNSMQEDEGNFAEGLKSRLEGKWGDMEQWTEPMKKAVIKAVRDVYSKAEGVSKEEADKLANQTLTTVFRFRITTDFELDNSQLNDWQTELDNLTENQFTTIIRMAPDYLTALSEIQKATDEAQKQLDDAKLKMPIDIQFNGSFGMRVNEIPGYDGMSASQKDAANSMLNWLKQLAGARAGNITPTPQKSKGGASKDPLAESLKQRLDVLKKAYSEYKKELATMSKDAALERIKDAGIFDELFTGKYAIGDFGDYKKVLEKLLADAEASLEGLSEKDKNFKGRHDLVISLRTLLNLEIPRDETKEAFEKAKSEIDNLVKGYTDKWNFHKQLFELTGDRETSIKLAFGEDVAWQTQSQMLESILNTQLAERGLDVPLTISDEEAKEKLKGTPLYDLLWKPTKEAKLKEGIDLQINVAKAVADAASIADKIKVQMGLREADETMLRSSKKEDGTEYSETEIAAYLKKYDDRIEELKSSMLELLPIWEQIFGDHQYQSYGQIQAASDIAKQIIDNAKINKDANGKPVSFTSVYTDAEGNEQQIMGKISQLEKLRKAIQDLYKEGLKKNPFATLWENLKKVFNGDWKDKNITEKLALIGESAAESAQLVGNLAGQLANLFEAAGNDSMGQSMTDVQDVMNSVSNIGKGFAQGGLVGGIAAAAGEAIGWVTKAFQASARHKEALKTIMNETLAQQREYNLLLMQQNLEYKKASTIFGEDAYGKAKNAVKVMKDAYKDLQDELAGTAEQQGNERRKANSSRMFARMFGSGFDEAKAKLRQAYAGLADIEIKTGHKKTGLFGWGKGKDIYSSILSVYPDLIDANGKFNTSLAETIINTRKMSDEDKAALQNMIDLAEQAEAAYEELNSYMTDIFGELGSSMTDALVSAFANGSNAAEDFYDSVSDMLEALAKQMIYSVTLAPLIEEAQKKMMDVMQNDAMSDEQKFGAWTGILDGLLDDALKQQGVANDLFKKYQDMAAEKGYDIFKPDGDSKSGLSAGIQSSITEDTGSLVASYCNGIRGDVSVQTHDYWPRLLDDALPQMNVIAQSQLDTQRQIAENTLRNAVAAETIVQYSKSIDDRLRRAQADKSTGFWMR